MMQLQQELLDDPAGRPLKMSGPLCFTVFHWLSGKESACHCGGARDASSIPGSGRLPGGGNGNPSVFLLGKVRGQGSLVGRHPWGRKELDTTERAR